MVAITRGPFVLFVLSTLLRLTDSIFVDDAYHIDYHLALLGLPLPHATFFYRPHQFSNASLLYTISDKGYLGAINPKDGARLWRQDLQNSSTHPANKAFLVGSGDGQLLSGYGDKVTCWDASTGRVVWEQIVPGTVVRGVQTIPTVGTAVDVIMLTEPVGSSGPVIVSKVDGEIGSIKWQYKDSSISKGATISLATSDQSVFYVSKSDGLLTSGKVKVVTLNAETGKEQSQQSVAVDSQPLGGADQYSTVSSRGAPFLLSGDKPFKTLKLTLLGSSKVATITLDAKGQGIESVTAHYPSDAAASCHFLLHIQSKTKHWAEVYHVNQKNGDVTKAYSLPATEEDSTFAVSNVGATVYFTRITETETSLYSSESHGRLAQWPRTGGVSRSIGAGVKASHAAAEVINRGSSGFAVRVAEASAAGDFSLIRNGELQWTRPEMLAYATLAAWEEREVQEGLVHELEVEASVNPLTAYVHRVTRHLHDLAKLPKFLVQIPSSFSSSPVDSAMSTRKALIGRKVVLIGTSRKELLALEAHNAGAIKWHVDLSRTIKPDASMTFLSVETGRASIYTSDGSRIVVSAEDGKVVEHSSGKIPIHRLVQLPGQPATAIVKVNDEGIPQLATDFAPYAAVEGNSLVTLSKQGTALGWSAGQSLRRTWTITPVAGAKIVNAVARPAQDPVASIGKVLGDRSVLYKYISPNLALLTATSPTTLTMYVVDAVTGIILHTASHVGVDTSSYIPSVISENWFAYTFTIADPNTGGLSTQLVIGELYESSIPNQRGPLGPKTNYSSFSTDARFKPHVISQAFTIAEPISELSVTQTAQGITAKFLLATLPDSNAIIGIPREILNPRRPVDRPPTSIEQEEGLMQYQPVLELDPRWYLTHSRDVIGINKIVTCPTQLESTGMVFAFGHDIFGTQVSPSMAFDVLGKGFNRSQLVLTVVALAVGVALLRPVVRSRGVEGRWKL